MWQTIRYLGENQSIARETNDLVQSVTRILILITSLVPAVVYLVVALVHPETRTADFFRIALIAGAGCILSLRLMPHAPTAAQIVWQLELMALITVTISVFREPGLAFLYAFMPVVTVGVFGWPAGLLSMAVVFGVVSGLPGWLGMPPLKPVMLTAILVGTVLSWMISWAVTNLLLSNTEWALDNYRQARRNIEETREQRLELKQIQEDLMKANQELARLSHQLKVMYQVAEESRQAKEEFVANVSHELRTPLNMIIAFSEMITQSPALYGVRLPPALLADIAIIQRNSMHLSKLVDDVLDLSQVEAGRMALAREWVPVGEVVEAACKATEVLFRSKGLYLHLNLPSGLPQLYCDRTRIRQILVNLLSNAGRFTEEGGVEVRVWEENRRVVFQVADTGPGIAPEDQRRLFEPFQQLDPSIRRKHGGSGLGLSISKRFVEMHNGSIWLESEPGRGTSIYFSLPLDYGPPEEGVSGEPMTRWFNPYQEYTPRTRKFKAPAPTLRPRFLALDPGQTLPRLLQRHMEGAEITRVATVTEAVTDLARLPANALIINALSAAPDGTDAEERFNEVPFGIPVITCWVPNEIETSNRLGIVNYVLKPVTRDQLLQSVRGLGSGIQTILVADDEPELQQLFARILQSAEPGYRVLRAENGLQALQMMRDHRPDAVLLDLMMPEMDGFGVLAEKNNDPAIKNIPVIVVTSKDFSNEPVISNRIAVTRNGGISSRDLLICIEALSAILNPGGQTGVPAPTETPDD